MQSSFTRQSPGPVDDNRPPQHEIVDINLTVRHTIQTWQARLSADPHLRNRVITHLTMLLLALAALGLSQLELPWGTINAIHPLKYTVEDDAISAETAEQELALTLPSQLRNIQDDVLVRGAVPRTIIPDRTAKTAGQNPAAPSTPEIKIYSVQSGDTISGIAAKFGLSPETIIWSNPDLERNPDLLSVGQELNILPVDGVYHQVGGGDTIEGIASTFQTDPTLIINFPANHLDPDNLVIQPGQWLVVPGGQKPFRPRAVTAYSGPLPDDAAAGTGIFGWPTSGTITQGYYSYHPGLDIAGWLGAPILAADSGHVVAAGWDNTGYGYRVVVDHGNGFQTLYAHLQSYYVEAGDNVSKGEQIGEMGSTGNSTGPHLHFEIRHGTIQRNPWGFLP